MLGLTLSEHDRVGGDGFAAADGVAFFVGAGLDVDVGVAEQCGEGRDASGGLNGLSFGRSARMVTSALTTSIAGGFGAAVGVLRGRGGWRRLSTAGRCRGSARRCRPGPLRRGWRRRARGGRRRRRCGRWGRFRWRRRRRRAQRAAGLEAVEVVAVADAEGAVVHRWLVREAEE